MLTTALQARQRRPPSNWASASLHPEETHHSSRSIRLLFNLAWCVPGERLRLALLRMASVAIADARWSTAEAEEEMGMDLVLLPVWPLGNQLHQRALPNVRYTAMRLLPRGENPSPRVNAVLNGLRAWSSTCNPQCNTPLSSA